MHIELCAAAAKKLGSAVEKLVNLALVPRRVGKCCKVRMTLTVAPFYRAFLQQFLQEPTWNSWAKHSSETPVKHDAMCDKKRCSLGQCEEHLDCWACVQLLRSTPSNGLLLSYTIRVTERKLLPTDVSCLFTKLNFSVSTICFFKNDSAAIGL